ncbi:MAG: hypothetical protein M3R15_31720 [Acidobacteriota bacterium]|nr:hypothetical protein [Acidobacteriota bacterium]
MLSKKVVNTLSGIRRAWFGIFNVCQFKPGGGETGDNLCAKIAPLTLRLTSSCDASRYVSINE